MRTVEAMFALVVPAVSGTGFVLGAMAGRSVRRRLMAQIAELRAQLLELGIELAEALHRAVTDPLTGLANRAGLTAFMANLAAGSTSFAVVLLDLDDFKDVNDTLGHEAGDAVLVEVGRRLRLVTGGYGMVARLGGDEFVIAATSPTELMSQLLAGDALKCLFAPMDVAGRRVQVHASVGMAHGAPGDEPARLLRAADLAMYETKARGGDDALQYQAGVLPIVERRPLVRLRELLAFSRDLFGVKTA